MKNLLTLALITAATLSATAQTPKPIVHHTSIATCAKAPELSPKIPALPSTAPCTRTLYTITTTPSVKLENVSPLEGPGLKETLGLASNSFSLLYIDYKVGTGALAAPHKFYSIHYTGYLTDGTKFDSSLDRGEPIVIGYGQHQVIPGWDTGFDGMHVGGKRRLFIPYELAYGAAGKPPTIPAKSELIFDVELVAQNDEKPAPPAPKAPPTPPTPPTAPGTPATPPPPAAPAGATPPPAPATPPPAGAPVPPPSPAGATAPPPTTSQTPAATTAAPAPKK